MSDQPNSGEPVAIEPTEPITEPTPEGQQGQPPAAALNPDTTPQQEPMIPKKRFDEVNKRLKELEKAETEAKKLADEAARKAAEEQGKWKELYETERASGESARKAADEAERKAIAAELATLKFKIASELGIPVTLADRLMGEDEEQIRADAAKILEVIPKGRPNVPTLTDAVNGIGGQPSTVPVKSDDEIREDAARLGVSFEHLKKHYERQNRS